MDTLSEYVLISISLLLFIGLPILGMCCFKKKMIHQEYKYIEIDPTIV
jgi:hypothetical protein